MVTKLPTKQYQMHTTTKIHGKNNRTMIFQDLGKILERSWKDLGKILERSWKDSGKIVERSWKDLGKILERSWKDLGKILERSWKDIGKIFQVPRNLARFTNVGLPSSIPTLVVLTQSEK